MSDQKAFLTGSVEPITDLYKQAVAFGKEQTEKNLQQWPDQEAYWAAWFAGRRAAGALLEEAEAMGLTADQIERLRIKASDVAYD